jgi:hypothetical protein
MMRRWRGSGALEPMEDMMVRRGSEVRTLGLGDYELDVSQIRNESSSAKNSISTTPRSASCNGVCRQASDRKQSQELKKDCPVNPIGCLVLL